MRISRFIVKAALLLAALSFVSGCDFLRSLSGRPTSADIEAKREMLSREESAHKARLDSLAASRKMLSDSLAFVDSLRESGSKMIQPGRLGGLESSQLRCRYYIVVGVFAKESNADNQARAVSDAGYEVVFARFLNGCRAVMLCASDNLRDVYENLKTVKTEKFCPPDVWILVNE